MEQNLKYFFEKLNEMETKTKFMVLLLTIFIPILDLILYNYVDGVIDLQNDILQLMDIEEV